MTAVSEAIQVPRSSFTFCASRPEKRVGRLREGRDYGKRKAILWPLCELRRVGRTPGRGQPWRGVPAGRRVNHDSDDGERTYPWRSKTQSTFVRPLRGVGNVRQGSVWSQCRMKDGRAVSPPARESAFATSLGRFCRAATCETIHKISLKQRHVKRNVRTPSFSSFMKKFIDEKLIYTYTYSDSWNRNYKLSTYSS